MDILSKLSFLALLKRKIVLIPLAAFTTLFIIVLSLKEDDEEFEIQSKFPLEDYLFQDSAKRQREIDTLQQEVAKLQNQLKSQEEQVKKQQERILLGHLKDKAGNPIQVDENGNLILYDKDGNRVLYDENGKPYTIGTNGEKKYLNSADKVFNQNGVEIERNDNGGIILYDDKNNRVELENGNKATYTRDGKKIVEDKNGNFTIYDEKGNVIAQGNTNNDEAYTSLKEQKNPDKPSDYNPFAGSPYSKQNQQNTPQLAQQSQSDKLFYDDDGNLIGDRVALENQKFIDEKADDKQKMINDILASRLQEDESKKKRYEKDYGASEFSNLEDKDDGSNEHKLLRTITADRMIPAFLVRPISSQIPGSAVAQVETNIYGAMGRAVLIPKGSKVIGFYQSNNKIGEYRLQIIWTRIITPQGNNIMLTDAKGADVKGYNGLIGEVHTRNFERYGIPLTLSTLSNGLLLAVNSLNQKGTIEQSKSEAGNLANAYIQSQILSGMRQDVSSIIQKIVQEQIKIQPIITIKEGSRIFIAPTQDIFIPIPKKGEAMARFFTELKEVKKIKPTQTLESSLEASQDFNEDEEEQESEE